MWYLEFGWRHEDENYVSNGAVKLKAKRKHRAKEEALKRWPLVQKEWPHAQGPSLVFRVELNFD